VEHNIAPASPSNRGTPGDGQQAGGQRQCGWVEHRSPCWWPALALGACGFGSTGSVSLVGIGGAPGTGTGAAQGVLATYEVEGPTRNAVVVCTFAGRHGTPPTQGWTIHKRVPDLKAGESARDTCQAVAFPTLGDVAPTQPDLSITTIEKMEPAPANWQTEHVPPTPWP
jgi:hypothetical protein